MVFITPGIDFLGRGAIFISIPTAIVVGLAARLGARIAPVAQGKWIGNFDFLRMVNEKFEYGYPGASSTCQEGSDVIQLCHQVMVWTNLLNKRGSLSILWSDMIFTTSPEYIKTILATDFHNYVKGLSCGDPKLPDEFLCSFGSSNPSSPFLST